MVRFTLWSPSSRPDRQSFRTAGANYGHRRWALVCLSVVVISVWGGGGAVSAAAPSPSQIGLQPSDVPSGWTAVDPSIESLQSGDTAFLQCAGSTPLISAEVLPVCGSIAHVLHFLERVSGLPLFSVPSLMGILTCFLLSHLYMLLPLDVTLFAVMPASLILGVLARALAKQALRVRVFLLIGPAGRSWIRLFGVHPAFAAAVGAAPLAPNHAIHTWGIPRAFAQMRSSAYLPRTAAADISWLRVPHYRRPPPAIDLDCWVLQPCPLQLRSDGHHRCADPRRLALHSQARYQSDTDPSDQRGGAAHPRRRHRNREARRAVTATIVERCVGPSLALGQSSTRDPMPRGDPSGTAEGGCHVGSGGLVAQGHDMKRVHDRKIG